MSMYSNDDLAAHVADEHEELIITFSQECGNDPHATPHELRFDLQANGWLEVLAVAHEQRMVWYLDGTQRQELIAYLQEAHSRARAGGSER